MKLIAHRGLYDGFNEDRENHPDQINSALLEGYDAEIDVRYIDGAWYLGHDEATYEIDADFLQQDGLWIHCKNLDALVAIKSLPKPVNYFWHQNDDFTLTSFGYVWTYPGKQVSPELGIYVQPEWGKNRIEEAASAQAAGICSKFVKIIRASLN